MLSQLYHSFGFLQVRELFFPAERQNQGVCRGRIVVDLAGLARPVLACPGSPAQAEDLLQIAVLLPVRMLCSLDSRCERSEAICFC